MEKLVTQDFGISINRGMEIVADMVSVIAFTELPSNDIVIKHLLSNFKDSELHFAFMSFGKIGQQHEDMHLTNTRSLIQVGFDLQKIHGYEERGDLAIRIYQKIRKVYETQKYAEG